MKYILISLVLLVSTFISCEDDANPTPECGIAPIYLEESSAIISDPFQIVSAKIKGECLEIEISSGGCDGSRWEGQLFIFPDVAESYPPQIWGEFSLTNDEECDAVVRRTFTFDFSGLSRISDRVILHLNGYDEPLHYPGIDMDAILSAWSLVNINGGLAGTNQSFESGAIIWDFDEDSVAITNSANDDEYVGFKSGTFEYSVEKSGSWADLYELTIDRLNLGPITKLTSDSLVVDQRPVDGLQYILIK